MGQTVMKPNARKVRRLGDGKVIGGFAGATADAFTLFERLERKLERASGPAAARRGRARQGLAHRQVPPQPGGDDDRRRQGRDADPDRQRRRARTRERRRRDRIGRQLRARRRPRAGRIRDRMPRSLCRKAMAIAAELCVYTNDRLTVETMDSDHANSPPASGRGRGVGGSAHRHACPLRHTPPTPNPSLKREGRRVT